MRTLDRYGLRRSGLAVDERSCLARVVAGGGRYVRVVTDDGEAVDTLRTIQADTSVAAGVRVQAAGGLIARVTALREATHVEARLSEVEAAIAQTLWATA